MALELNVADPAKGNPNVAPVVNSNDDQFFDDVLGDPNKANPSVVSDPARTQKPPVVVDEATKRFEYWQSQADHFKNEAEKIKPLALEYQKFAPVIEFLKEHPEEIERIGKTSQPAPSSVQTLKQPVKPTPPANYSVKEAYNDPESESFKYRVAQDEYSRQLTEFMYAKQELQEKELQNRSRLEQARQMESQKLQQLNAQLVAEYGFTPEQAVDFIQIMNGPESTKIDNLVNLYKVIKHKTKAATIARTNANPPAQIPPPPIGGGGGDIHQQPTEEEQFFGGIASFGKPMNPMLTREEAKFSR